jgi:branched-chain amino acid transport system permease protein
MSGGRTASIAFAVGTVVALAIPLVTASPVFLNLVILVFLFAYLASCWNILGGLAGQHSFGHALFFGIGAYTSTLLALHAGVTPWLGMWLGAALAALVGLFVGFLSFKYRIQGVFFLMITIAFAEIFKIVVFSAERLGGAGGINIRFSDAPAQFQFSSKVPYYYVALAMLLAVVGIVLWLRNGRTGYYFLAIRENEDAAKALGIDTFRYKLVATGISAALTALGGTFYAQYFFYIDPVTVFGIPLSVEILIFAVVGGEGTVLGPILGAILLVPVAEVLRVQLGGSFRGVHLIGYAALVMLTIMYMPRGLVGAFARQRS